MEDDRRTSFDFQLELVHDVIASDISVDHEDVSESPRDIVMEEPEKEHDAHGPVQSNTRYDMMNIN